MTNLNLERLNFIRHYRSCHSRMLGWLGLKEQRAELRQSVHNMATQIRLSK